MVSKSVGRQTEPGSHSPKVWTALLLLVLIWLGLALSADIRRPWINALDYNGAVWSQSAHNILRAGLTETSGASTGFYFGPLPIPPWGYYLHHPPLLHLVLAGLFVVFGEHEWVARMVPISCSLGSAILLWLLVRSCAGTRAATLSTAIFACLPMELRYGKMVNFEPVVLALILGALWCIRNWKIRSDTRWKTAAVGLVVLGMWVDWAMYLFVLALCVCWFSSSDADGRRLAKTFFISALISVLLYLTRIHFLRPDAWDNLTHAFFYRIGSGSGGQFTEVQWLERVGSSLTAHFLPIGWILATFGSAITIRYREHNEGLRWLGWACVSVSAMDGLFLAVFQNDSYIHQYVGFYMVAPVSIMAGVAVDYVIARVRNYFTAGLLPYAVAGCAACLLPLAVGIQGERQTNALEQQFRILDYKSQEPANLIPELGRTIRQNFSPGTQILCNFLPAYGPQLEYYAQRELLNNLSDFRFWRRYLQGPPKRIGGGVWMGSRTANKIVNQLPTGPKQFIKLDGISFCLWKPISNA